MTAASQMQETASADEAERAAACALAGLGGIGGQSIAILRSAYGSLAKAAARGGKALAETPGLRSDGADALRAAPDLESRGQWLLAKARQTGARVLLLGDPDYPSLLAAAAGAPPVLYAMGTLGETRRVAIVGSRHGDVYGDQRTAAAVDQLCGAGVEVVSGGAEGVDTIAHGRALELGGKTIAVLGSGFLSPYPKENRGLFDRIAKEGVLLSEFALDAGGQRTHFPQRNRTIAGLSEAVILTRGRSNSGALTTCQTAVKLNRPVFAVPGRVDEPLAAAPNALLAAGTARALVTGAEVLLALGMAANAPPAVRPVMAAAEGPRLDDLPAEVRQVFATLGPAPRHIDDIAQEAGLATAATLAALLRLELSGLCATRPGKYFLRR